MGNKAFDVIAAVIRSRRTVKPVRMNGAQIPDEDIHALLALADWAPTHKRTEPWRFIVFEGAHLSGFAERHVDLYRRHADPEQFREGVCRKIMMKAEKASHLVIVAMKRSPNSKIVRDEEYAAVAAAIQNILLGAAALDIAALWSTGSMSAAPEMKTLLNLAQEDEIVGFLYLGYTDTPAARGLRMTPLADKIIWNKTF